MSETRSAGDFFKNLGRRLVEPNTRNVQATIREKLASVGNVDHTREYVEIAGRLVDRKGVLYDISIRDQGDDIAFAQRITDSGKPQSFVVIEVRTIGGESEDYVFNLVTGRIVRVERDEQDQVQLRPVKPRRQQDVVALVSTMLKSAVAKKEHGVVVGSAQRLVSGARTDEIPKPQTPEWN